MPTSSSRLAYSDCYELFDKAMEDDAGVRAEVLTASDGIALRTRLHTARRIDRDENAKSYELDHPMHGKSIYDTLQVKLREHNDRHYVYLVKIILNHQVESLSQLRQLEAPEIKMLAAPIKVGRRV